MKKITSSVSPDGDQMVIVSFVSSNNTFACLILKSTQVGKNIVK